MGTAIRWTTGAGAEVEMTLTPGYGLDLRGNRRTSGRMEILASATVNGLAHEGHGVETVDHPVAVARYGKIGLTQDVYSRYLAAHAEVAEMIADHNRAYDAHEDWLDAIADEGERMARDAR